MTTGGMDWVRGAGTLRDDALVGRLMSVAGSSSASLVVVVGSPGSGRTALLDQVRDAMREKGVHVLSISCAAPPFAVPLHVSLGSVDLTSTSDAGSTRPAADGAQARGVAVSAMRKALTDAGVGAVLVDDAQWLDQRSVGLIDTMVRGAGPRLVWICTATAPMSAEATAVVRKLTADGLATVMTLRPLISADVESVVSQACQARPSVDLIARLRQLTSGNWAALTGALTAYQEAGAIRIVGRHAQLECGADDPILPDQHQLIAAIRRKGAEIWRVAKAAAVLNPLGTALPELIGQALGMAVADVHEAFEVLREHGVLRQGAQGWRFGVRLVAASIVAQLGPYERRHLAATAVTALWTGTAACDDDAYRADQLAAAGKLVDPRRACAELVEYAEGCGELRRKAYWLQAASNLVADRGQRAVLLARHAMTCYRLGAYAESIVSAEDVLRDPGPNLTDGDLDELAQMLVLARHAVDDDPALSTEVNPPAREAIVQATGLLADNWSDDCLTLLERTTSTWRGRGSTARLGARLIAQARFYRDGTVEHDDWRLRILPMILTGDVDDADKLLAGYGATVEDVDLPFRAVLALRHNRFDEGLALARSCVAAGRVPGCEPVYTLVYQWLANLMLARGELADARDLLVTARAEGLQLPHLLDAAEGAVDMALGDYESARDRLRHGLDTAARQGIALETDLLWALLAEAESRLGNADDAGRCVNLAVQVAADVGGGEGNALRSLVARAIVCDDAEAAVSAVRLARGRGRPLELCDVICKLAWHGFGDVEGLTHAYEAAGTAGALLYRAWLRDLMRDRNVPVPGRSLSVVENEQLLAGLVADGLSNKDVAAVLQSSAKSVEGRLSRLFTKSGYQSRVELATAVHTGMYQKRRDRPGEGAGRGVRVHGTNRTRGGL